MPARLGSASYPGLVCLPGPRDQAGSWGVMPWGGPWGSVGVWVRVSSCLGWDQWAARTVSA